MYFVLVHWWPLNTYHSSQLFHYLLHVSVGIFFSVQVQEEGNFDSLNMQTIQVSNPDYKSGATSGLTYGTPIKKELECISTQLDSIEKSLETVLDKLGDHAQQSDMFHNLFSNLEETQAILNTVQPQQFQDDSQLQQSISQSFDSSQDETSNSTNQQLCRSLFLDKNQPKNQKHNHFDSDQLLSPPGNKPRSSLNTGAQPHQQLDPGLQSPLSLKPGEQPPHSLDPGPQPCHSLDPCHQPPHSLNTGHQASHTHNTDPQAPHTLDPSHQAPHILDPGRSKTAASLLI